MGIRIGLFRRKFNRGTSAKGYFIKWKDYETTLKWTAVAKRIEELISVGRYMTEKELEYIPEYEKGVLSRGIYNFFYHQPETFYVRIRMAQIIIER